MPDDNDDNVSPAEYITQNLFTCWTTELSNIISNLKQHMFIRESTKEVHNDFPIIQSLLVAGHRLSPAFRELIIEYIASLDTLLAQHAKHEELFDLKDGDCLAEQDLEKDKLIFDSYYLDESERYWINKVKAQFAFDLNNWELIHNANAGY